MELSRIMGPGYGGNAGVLGDSPLLLGRFLGGNAAGRCAMWPSSGALAGPFHRRRGLCVSAVRHRNGGASRAARTGFDGLKSVSMLAPFSKVKESRGEESELRKFLGFKALLWEKVGEVLHSIWQPMLTGNGVEREIGADTDSHRSSCLSHFLHVSLYLSLYLGCHCCAPESALARTEALDIIGDPQQIIPTHSLETFHSKGYAEGFAKVPQKDYFRMDKHERSPSMVTMRSGTFQTGVVYSLAEAKNACEESYGFLPCSNSSGGNLSLIVAYGYCLLLGAQLISKGSELLLEVMNAGLLGGLLLPILGALPDALLVLVSGIGGTTEQAQEQVMVGVGVLAGSTVMLLTIGWAGSLFAGRCDLSGPGGTAKDGTLTQSLDWTGTGVTTDEQTSVGAWIALLSAIPFLIVQIPLLDGHPTEGPEAALTGCILAFLGLLVYSFYQVSFPWLQQKRIGEARLQFMRSRALQRVTAFTGRRAAQRPSLLQENMSGPSSEHLKQLFASFDENRDGKIQKQELRGLLVGLELEEAGSVPDSTQLEMWLQEFDVDLDGTLSEHEFFTGIGKWAQKISKEKWSRNIQQRDNSWLKDDDPRFWAARSSEAKKVLDLLETEAAVDDNDGGEEGAESVKLGTIQRNAALYLAGGAALAAVFADPLVDSIGGFSEASGIPPFFVAFVVTPFASNASELFSSLIFARGRRKKNISLTFSQLYGGVTMNNTMCLGLFLGVVYARGLRWDFSSEVTVILLSVVALGVIGGSRTTFPLWVTLPVLAIYPFCISLVALLDNLLGWH